MGADLTVTDDTATDASRYISFVDVTSGVADEINVSSTKLYFNPSTGTLNATEFNSLSDANFKTSIKTIDAAMVGIDSLNPVEYRWKDTNKKSYGIMAQELENVYPELVTENNGVKSVSYIPLIAILIAEIQNLKKKLQ